MCYIPISYALIVALLLSMGGTAAEVSPSNALFVDTVFVEYGDDVIDGAHPEKACLARSVISSGGTSSTCVAICHSWPNGSRTLA